MTRHGGVTMRDTSVDSRSMGGRENALGEAIRSQRTAKRWSQARTGVFFGGVDQGTVSRWEDGIQRPADSHDPQIARFLGITEDEVKVLKYGLEPSTLRQVFDYFETAEDRDAITRRQIANVEERIAELEDQLGRIADALGLNSDSSV